MEWNGITLSELSCGVTSQRGTEGYSLGQQPTGLEVRPARWSDDKSKAPKNVHADVDHDLPNPTVVGETTNVWDMGCRTSSKTTRMGLGSIRFIIPGANSDSAHCALSLDLLARSVSQEGPTAPAHSLLPHFTNDVSGDEGDSMTLARLITQLNSHSRHLCVTAAYGVAEVPRFAFPLRLLEVLVSGGGTAHAPFVGQQAET